jgi:hypothetical protein
MFQVLLSVFPFEPHSEILKDFYDKPFSLQIGVKYKPQKCDLQAHKGDKIKVHYRVSFI